MPENNLLCLPKKVYFKKGCTPIALRELKEAYHFKKALLLSDPFTYQLGTVGKIDKLLRKQGFSTSTFFSFSPVPTMSQVQQAISQAKLFNPEVIIGIGGNCAMSAAKGVLLFEERDKRNLRKLVLIATSFSSGGQTSPLAILNVDKKNIFVNSNASLPEISITDGDFTDDLTPEQIKASLLFFQKLTKHSAHEPGSDDLTKGLYEEALWLISKYKTPALEGDPVAKEKLHNAIAMMGPSLMDVK